MAGLLERLKEDSFRSRIESEFADRVNCPRCKTKDAFQGPHNPLLACLWCGMSFYQHVRRSRRKVIGGKRGRNSGTTNTSKTK